MTDSPAMMLRGMSGLVFGIHVAHSEGLLHFLDAAVHAEVIGKQLVPLVCADDSGAATAQYPFNPNGALDVFGLCPPDVTPGARGNAERYARTGGLALAANVLECVGQCGHKTHRPSASQGCAGAG